MHSLSFVAFLIVTLAAVGFVFSTIGELPEQVATHFGANNRADAWMTRDGYGLYMSIFLIGLPVVLVFCVGVLPRLIPQWTNIPNRDYWLAPAKREEALRFLTAHGYWLGCLTVLMIAGTHYAILAAHHSQPPVLPLPIFFSVLGGFVLALLFWTIILYRRFRIPKYDSSLPS